MGLCGLSSSFSSVDFKISQRENCQKFKYYSSNAFYDHTDNIFFTGQLILMQKIEAKPKHRQPICIVAILAFSDLYLGISRVFGPLKGTKIETKDQTYSPIPLQKRVKTREKNHLHKAN